MRRFLNYTKKPADLTKALIAQWQLTLSKLKDSLPVTMHKDTERALVSKSNLRNTLASLKTLLFTEEQTSDGTIGPCLEYCLESRFFAMLVSEAYVGRPKGLFEMVLGFLTDCALGIQRQFLIPHKAFHGPICDLLLYISEQMKKGNEFVSSEVVELLHALAMVVQGNPSYAAFFYRPAGDSLEYMPLPILLMYFREESQCEQPKLRESLLLCTQLEDKDVVAHILKDTDIIQVLILKLGSYFQTLPQVWRAGEGESRQELEEMLRYVEFLNGLCEKCLWKELLSEVGAVFQSLFCEGILSPRLQHSEISIRGTTAWYLSLLLDHLSSPVLLMPLVYYLRGKRPRECMYLPTPRGRKSINFEDDGQITPRTETRLTCWSTWLMDLDSKNELLRLRSLQLLYALTAKRQWRILKILFVESFRQAPSDQPVSISEFSEKYRKWMVEEAMNESYLQCHSSVLSSVLSRSESYSRNRRSWVATGETESMDRRGRERESGSTGGLYPVLYVDCGELLSILLKRLKLLETNSFQENILITVPSNQGIFSLILSFPGQQIQHLQQFLLGRSAYSLATVLEQLDEKIQSQRRAILNFDEALQIARLVHSDAGKEHPLHGVMKVNDAQGRKIKNVRLADVRNMQAFLVFEEFVNELGGILYLQEQMARYRKEADALGIE